LSIHAPLLVGAVALIDSERRVLMQRRRLNAEHGGLWEFPGGKLEPGETPEAATVREIAEELALEVEAAALHPVGFASGTSPSGRVIVLLLYACREWRGTPECRDAEAIGWFEPEALAALPMPPLDVLLTVALRRLL
jgi:8-oxo-dGTP diphosphatase